MTVKILRTKGNPISVAVEYGYLYNWYAAVDTRNIAPVGWHVPTQTELSTLVNYLGGSSVAGGKLKETGFTHWDNPNTGADNSSGFNARGCGQRTTGFELLGTNFFMWSVTAFDATAARRLNMGYNYTNTNYGANIFSNGYSIRLIKDSSTYTPTVTGNDGKVYNCVQIGTQIWMSENLMETKYRDGSPIPEEQSNANWANATTGLRCSYNNDEANAGDVTYSLPKVLRQTTPIQATGFGRLYNWYAASDARGFVSGWHLPSQAELNTLLNYIDTYNPSLFYWPNAAIKLKKAGTDYWIYQDWITQTNETGFSGIGHGSRDFAGNFLNLRADGIIWSSTYVDATYAKGLLLAYTDNGSLPQNRYKKAGAAIRLLCDSSTDPGSVIIDGLTYPTIKIGSQVWLAANLQATHYANGYAIPNVTDSTAWSNLTTGAYCAYGNDNANIGTMNPAKVKILKITS